MICNRKGWNMVELVFENDPSVQLEELLKSCFKEL